MPVDAGPMSPSMREALGAMPIELQRTSRGWVKPVGAPHGYTLKALEARGVVRLNDKVDPPRWERVVERQLHLVDQDGEAVEIDLRSKGFDAEEEHFDDMVTLVTPISVDGNPSGDVWTVIKIRDDDIEIHAEYHAPQESRGESEPELP